MSKTKKAYNDNLKEIVEAKRKEWSENLKDISPLIRSKDLHDMTEAQALALSYRTMLLDEIAFFISELSEEQKFLKEYKRDRLCLYRTGLLPDGSRPKNMAKNPLIGHQKITGSQYEQIISGDLSDFEYTNDILVSIIEYLRENVKTIDQYMYAIKNRLELFAAFK